MKLFDHKFYYENYVDLKGYSTDPESLMQHYLQHGVKENRLPSKNFFYKLYPTFDWEYYISKKRLKNYNEAQAICHYYTHGNDELYIRPVEKPVEKKSNSKEHFIDSNEMGDGFDADFYMKTYPDVIEGGFNTPELAYKHWNQHGKNENRKCYDDREVDLSFYMDYYNDVPQSYADAKKHWYQLGKRLNRARVIESAQEVINLQLSIDYRIDEINSLRDRLDNLNSLGSDYQTIRSIKVEMEDHRKALQKEILDIQNFYKIYHRVNDTTTSSTTNIIYTCITQNYDNAIPPRYITPGWRYILFSDVYIEAPNGWEVIYIDNPDNLEPTKLARRVKTRYWEYLPQHDKNIWIDSNVIIRKDLNQFCNDVTDDVHSCWTVKHPDRRCTYEEAVAILELGKDRKEIVDMQINSYKQQGFPAMRGDLFETNCIIRNDTPEVRLAMRHWFNEIKNHSRRDQLSIKYILWKHDLEHLFKLFPTTIRDRYVLWSGGHGRDRGKRKPGNHIL